MITDPIADMFTLIRNGVRAQKRAVTIPASNIKKEITRVLHENGYIAKYAFVNEGPQGDIKILLKYNSENVNAIQDIQRISKPSIRVYKSATEIPRILNGLGVCLVSTSKGLMTDYQCRKSNLGGELVGKIW
jgi:small subunit ribosomal protein S8